MFYSIVILTLTCISFVPPSLPYLCSYIDFLLSARSVIAPLPDCHALNPMRHLSRVPTVLTHPRPPCSDQPCLLSRPLSSLSPLQSTNTAKHLHSPVADHLPRFDWRLRVPTPKPPLSTVQKVPERRAQPPLPAYSHPYSGYIQKYKDQSVTRHVRALPI